MRGKKIKAIQRTARQQNEGENPNSTDLRLLKKFNKFNSIPNILKGNLLTETPELSTAEKTSIQKIRTSSSVAKQTIGKLKYQWKRKYGTK